jgi:DNA-directed RNA polymerase specialized sigma24 family protein
MNLRLVAEAWARRSAGYLSPAVPSRTLDAGEQIASPRAFVAIMTTRLAIDELRSAGPGRECDVGGWLPGPIITDSHDDPADRLRQPARCH